jgi:hypothetical protein
MNNRSLLFLNNDSLPFQRVLIHAARKNHLKGVVCIQHGLYQSNISPLLMDGWLSDYFFVINDFQRKIAIKNGMNPDSIKVLGFHGALYKSSRMLSSPSDRRVCILGQPWSKYNDHAHQRYIKILKDIVKILNEDGIFFVYKPHPAEDDIPFFIKSHIFRKGLNKAIDNFDVFISMTSTALLEVSSTGRIAIQIDDGVFESDNFESIYSGVKTVGYSDLSFILHLIKIEEVSACIDLQRGIKMTDLCEDIFRE